MKELKSVHITLENILGDLLPNIPDKSVPLNIDVNHLCEIERKGKDTEATLIVDTIVGPTPSSLFRIRIKHKVDLVYSSNITMDEVRNKAFEACLQIGTQISHVVSIISFELIGTHIIIPPNLNKDSFIIQN